MCRSAVAPAGGPAPLAVTFSSVFVDPNPGARSSRGMALRRRLRRDRRDVRAHIRRSRQLPATLYVEGSTGSRALISSRWWCSLQRARRRRDPIKPNSQPHVTRTTTIGDDQRSSRGQGHLAMEWMLGKQVGGETVGAPADMTVGTATGEVRWAPSGPARTEVSCS